MAKIIQEYMIATSRYCTRAFFL